MKQLFIICLSMGTIICAFGQKSRMEIKHDTLWQETAVMTGVGGMTVDESLSFYEKPSQVKELSITKPMPAPWGALFNQRYTKKVRLTLVKDSNLSKLMEVDGTPYDKKSWVINWRICLGYLGAFVVMILLCVGTTNTPPYPPDIVAIPMICLFGMIPIFLVTNATDFQPTTLWLMYGINIIILSPSYFYNKKLKKVEKMRVMNRIH